MLRYASRICSFECRRSSASAKRALSDLPAPRALRSQHQVLHELLRQRAGALRDLATGRVHDQGTTDGQEVEAFVIEEPVVLGGQDRPRNEAGHLGERQRAPTLESRLTDADEQLGLELGAGHVRAAGDVRHLGDAGIPHLQVDAHGAPGDVLPGADMDLPSVTGPAELAGLRRSGRDLPVAKPVEALSDRLDRDARPEPLAGGEDERRLLHGVEVEAGGGHLGPDGQGRDRRDRARQRRDGGDAGGARRATPAHPVRRRRFARGGDARRASPAATGIRAVSSVSW